MPTYFYLFCPSLKCTNYIMFKISAEIVKIVQSMVNGVVAVTGKLISTVS